MSANPAISKDSKAARALLHSLSETRAEDEAMASDTGEPIRLTDRLALRPKEAAAVLGLSERALRTLLPSLPHIVPAAPF